MMGFGVAKKVDMDRWRNGCRFTFWPVKGPFEMHEVVCDEWIDGDAGCLVLEHVCDFAGDTLPPESKQLEPGYTHGDDAADLCAWIRHRVAA